ncbi:hypothetical protein ACFU1R_26900 [Priestia megaterium]|uniref:hypothetical protein n=1 Tax=Priestia megaterium TaxID=1404 RepID=UPI00366F034D
MNSDYSKSINFPHNYSNGHSPQNYQSGSRLCVYKNLITKKYTHQIIPAQQQCPGIFEHKLVYSVLLPFGYSNPIDNIHGTQKMWPSHFIVTPVFEGGGYALTKLLSIRAERDSGNPNVINYLIYSDLGNFYRDSIGALEQRKDLTDIDVSFEYEGIGVNAKLNGYIENDINKQELCLRGKVKFKIWGATKTVDLDKDCDPY